MQHILFVKKNNLTKLLQRSRIHTTVFKAISYNVKMTDMRIQSCVDLEGWMIVFSTCDPFYIIWFDLSWSNLLLWLFKATITTFTLQCANAKVKIQIISNLVMAKDAGIEFELGISPSLSLGFLLFSLSTKTGRERSALTTSFRMALIVCLHSVNLIVHPNARTDTTTRCTYKLLWNNGISSPILKRRVCITIWAFRGWLE